MSRPCATRVDTARFFLSAGNAVPPPGPGARARVSPGGRVGHPVQQPKASARAVRPARRDRTPTRAGRAEPRGSLCRRGRGPGNGLPGRRFRCVLALNPGRAFRFSEGALGPDGPRWAAPSGPGIAVPFPFPWWEWGPRCGRQAVIPADLVPASGAPWPGSSGLLGGDRLDPPQRVLAIGSTRSISYHGRVPLSRACSGSMGQRSTVPSVSLSVS